MLTGGNDIASPRGIKTTYMHDLMESQWSKMADMKKAREDHACGSYQTDTDSIVVVAGGDFDSTVWASVENWKLSTGQWTEINPLPAPRNYVRMVTFNNRLVLLGYVDQVLEYDPSSDQWNPVGTATTVGYGFLAIPYNY